jgi:hypothetical protein
LAVWAADFLMLIAIWSAIRKYVFPFVGFSERAETDPAPRKPFRGLRLNDPPELRLATVEGGADFFGCECDGAFFHASLLSTLAMTRSIMALRCFSRLAAAR